MSFFRSALLLFVASTPAFAVVPVEGASGEWIVESADRASDAKIAPYLGRDALWLRNNTHVLREGLELIDGTIELDVAPLPGSHFFALVFRRESIEEHENIYFRPFQTGRFHAVQYAPRVRGASTWQLYPQFNAEAELPEEQWTHVRIEVRGPRMEIYLNGSPKPLIAVDRLRSLSKGSTVGVWARRNGEPETWAAAVSNVVIRPATEVLPSSLKSPPPPPGFLTRWQLGKTALPAQLRPTSVPPVGEWVAVEPEESGLVNIAKTLGRFREAHTAVARTTIEADQAKTVTLSVGYSDAVTVFLNGRPIYSAVNGWESRYPAYLGYVETGHEFVHLPLERGSNELVFVVTDDQRFGWGFAARLE